MSSDAETCPFFPPADEFGFCGSKEVVRLMRSSSGAKYKAKSHIEFARRLWILESHIMTTLENAALSYAPALQCIAERREWHTKRSTERKWLEAAFWCDVFSADTISATVKQCDIARSVISLVGKNQKAIALVMLSNKARGSDEVDVGSSANSSEYLEELIVRATMRFFETSGTPLESDPYFGVRMRHVPNVCREHVAKKLGWKRV